jgi:hypothetical protein
VKMQDKFAISMPIISQISWHYVCVSMKSPRGITFLNIILSKSWRLYTGIGKILGWGWKCKPTVDISPNHMVGEWKWKSNLDFFDQLIGGKGENARQMLKFSIIHRGRVKIHDEFGHLPKT